MSVASKLLVFLLVVACIVPKALAQYYYPSVASATLTSAGPFSPGQTVTLQFVLNPGTYAATRVFFGFTSTDGKYSRSLVTSTASSGVATAVIDASWPNATYRLNGVSIDDAAGETVSYDATGAIDFNPHAWFYPADGPRPNLSLSFSVAGGASPVSPATLKLTLASPTNITAGDSVSWSYTVTPGTSQKWSFSIDLMGPDHAWLHFPSVTGVGAASGTVTIPTSADWVSGTYTLSTISIVDENASSSSTVNAGFNLAGGVTTATPPTLTGVSISGHGPFGPNDTVTFTCAIKPGTSAIKSMNLNYAGPDLPDSYSGNLYIPVALDGTASLKITPTMLDGSYALYGFNITDTTGHTVSYYRSGQYLRSASTSTGLLNIPYPDANFSVAGALKIPPVITQQPVGGSVQPGNTLALSITATGPTGTVQWYQGQSGDTGKPVFVGYYFTPPAPASTVSYWARITTVYGSVDSNAATITVLYASPLPVIQKQPDAVYQAAGSSSSLSVSAIGPAPLNYQWYKDGVAVLGATNATLPFAPGALTDSGDYKVIVSNPNGSVTSNTVSVLFYGMPQITVQPVSATVPFGGTVSFSVTAIGGDLRYDWSFQGQSNYNYTPYPASSSNLTLTNIQPYQAGTYTVQVSNRAGRVSSMPVTLTVTNVPVPVVAAIEAKYGQINQFLSFVVSATNYPSHYSAVGLPVGLTIDDSGTVSGTPTDSGTFSVTISAQNAGGIGTRIFTLTIAASSFGPVITQQPQSQTLPLYTSATLSVVASGTPIQYFGLIYQWYFNGTAISLGGQDPTYAIYADSSAKAGDYSVMVTGTAGSVMSTVAHVVVDVTRSAPRITSAASDQVAVAGSPFNLAMSVTGSEPLQYSWAKSGNLIAGATAATLSINNISQAEAGLYTFTVSNPYGSVTTVSFSISVAYSVTPAAVSIRSGQSTTLSVPASAAVKYQWYQGKSGDVSKPISGATQSSYTTLPLQSSTSYWVNVSAGNYTYSSTATVTVTETATNFGGTYFGTFSSGGNWAMLIGSDNTGTFVGYTTQPGEALIGTVAVETSGAFSVTPAPSASVPASAAKTSALLTSATPSLSGQIANGVVTGAASGMTGALDSGTSTAPSGTYAATAVAGASGGANLLVGPSGKAVVVVNTPNGVTGAVGTLDASGAVKVVNASGDTLTVVIDAGGHNATVTLQAATRGRTSFYGLAAGTTNTSRLLNLSARARVSGTTDVAIVGFSTNGTTSKTVLIRGVGPSLVSFNVPEYLEAPAMTLYDGNAKALWSGLRFGTADTITNTATRVGAFPLLPTAIDCAYVGAIDAGGHSVILSGQGGGSGVCLVEMYEADTTTTGARLVNLSARAKTSGGADVLSAGFVIGGNGPETILLRGVGPGLAAHAVPGYLERPKLVLFNADREVLTSNSQWSGDATPQSLFSAVGAFPLNSGSTDTALLVTLAPGLYTAQVQSQDNTSGVALIEIYEVK